MFLLLRMYVAHFLADFPLQTTTVFRWKVHRQAIGLPIHGGIFFAAGAALAWPYWHSPWLWGYLAAATLLHILSDYLKLKTCGSGVSTPAIFLLDQAIHVLIVSSLILTPLYPLPAPAPVGGLWSWYYDDRLMKMAIGYILAVYFSPYFLDSVKQHWLGGRFPLTFRLTAAQMMTGKILRAAVLTGLLFLPGLWAWAAFAAILILPRTTGQPWAGHWLDYLITLVVGVILRSIL